MTVKLDNVSVKLGGQTILHDVSAQLAPGKLYVLVGPNGAGKSTLLRAMAALLPLSHGNILVNEADVARMTHAERAGLMAYLPQDRSIAWDLSSVDVAALGAAHLTPDLAKQRAFTELQALGLQEVGDRGVFGLSGGQRARVLLARVMVSPAQFYLLDEPLIALDPAWQRQVLVRLKQRADAGQTIVISLHDLQLAAQFADAVLLMHQGRLVRLGSPEDVFTPKDLREVFNLNGELLRQNGQRTLRLDSVPVF